MLGEGGRNYGPTPVVADGVAYLHNLHSKELFATPIKLNSCEPPRWKVEVGSLSKSPLCVDGLVYVPGKQMIVLNASDGSEVYRKDKMPGGWASPALAGKHIYFFSNSRVVVFEPGSEYKEVSSFPVQFRLRASSDKNLGASPVFDGKRIYFRGGGAMYCFGAK
jgi:hypothetical protein